MWRCSLIHAGGVSSGCVLCDHQRHVVIICIELDVWRRLRSRDVLDIEHMRDGCGLEILVSLALCERQVPSEVQVLRDARDCHMHEHRCVVIIETHEVQ